MVREIGKLRGGFTPYAVGQVDLGPGLRVMGVIEGDFDSLWIGMRLRTILRPQGRDEDGNDLVGYAFAPAEEPARVDWPQARETVIRAFRQSTKNI